MSQSFAELACGDQARILGFEALPEGYRRRLMSLGLTPGTLFRVERKAPLGDPIEIRVRGFSLSLRLLEAAQIRVEKL